VAVPIIPSSPVAVQVNLIEFEDSAVASRSVILFGGDWSVDAKVDPLTMFDIEAKLGRPS